MYFKYEFRTFYGFLLLGCFVFDLIQSSNARVEIDAKSNITKTKSINSRINQVTAHKRSKRRQIDTADIPKHFITLLDTSCMRHGLIRAPKIENVDTIRYMKKKTKQHVFLVATYRCEKGYELLNNTLRLYCSKRHWIGTQPMCIKKSELSFTQSDDAGVTPPQLPSAEAASGCPTDFRAHCEHDCLIEDAVPTCICFKGFLMIHGQCQDINECLINNGGCEKTCTNIQGSFQCSCPPSYRLSANTKTCEDINECLLRNGHGPCQDICTNTQGSYKCSCSGLTGTKLSYDQHTCEDLDECADGKAGCSHNCINTHGKAFCACPDGMELDADWKTCKEKPVSDEPGKEDDYEEEGEDDYGDEEDYVEQNEDEDGNEENSTNRKEFDAGMDHKAGRNNEENDTISAEKIDQRDIVKKSKTKQSITNNNKEDTSENTGKEDYLKNETVNFEENVENIKNEKDLNIENIKNEKDLNMENIKNEKDLDTQNIKNKEELNIENIKTEKDLNMENISKHQDRPKSDNQENVNYNTGNEDEQLLEEIDYKISTTEETGNVLTTEKNHIQNNQLATTKDNIKYKIEEDEESDDYEDEYEENSTDIIKISNTSEDLEEEKSNEDGNKKEDTSTLIKEKQKIHEQSLIQQGTVFNTNIEDKINKEESKKGINNFNSAYNIEDNFNKTDENTKKIYENEIEERYTFQSNIKDNLNKNIYEDALKLKFNDSDINVIKNEDKEESKLMKTSGEDSLHKIENDDDIIKENLDNNMIIKIENKKESHTENLQKIVDNSNQSEHEELIFDKNEVKINKIENKEETNIHREQVQDNLTESKYEEDDSRLKLEDNKIENKEEKHTENNHDLDENINDNNKLIETAEGSDDEEEEDDYEDEDYEEEDYNEENKENKNEEEAGHIDNTLIKIKNYTTVEEKHNEDSENDENENENDEETDIISENKIADGKVKIKIQDNINNIGTVTDNNVFDESKEFVENYDHNQVNLRKIADNSKNNIEHGADIKLRVIHNEGEKRDELIDGVTEKIKNVEGTDDAKHNLEDELETIKEDLDDDNNYIDLINLKDKTTEMPRNLEDDNHKQHTIKQNIDSNKTQSKNVEMEIEIKTEKNINENNQSKDEFNNTSANPFIEDTSSTDSLKTTTDSEVDNIEPPFIAKKVYVVGQEISTTQNTIVGTSRNVEDSDEDDYEYEEYEEEIETERTAIKSDNNVENNELSPMSKNCDHGFELNDLLECVDINECEDPENGCSDNCHNTIGSYKCTCPNGYEITEKDKYTCQDINECTTNPCSHKCVNTLGAYRCECPEKHHLQDDNCIEIRCSHTHKFVEGIVICDCPKGFELSNDNISCDDLNECNVLMPCEQICHNHFGNYSCACRTGFVLSENLHNCEIDLATTIACPDGYELDEMNRSCIDIDECISPFANDCSQTCVNVQGNYSCTCMVGFQLGGDGVTCSDIIECDIENECQQDCVNTIGSYMCSCKDGFIINENGFSCDDVNECLDMNGNCTHFCANLDGGYQCACDQGYELLGDKKTCVEINKCLENNGGCSHKCEYLHGKIACGCPDNYELYDKTCFKINPCQINNGGCSHTCEHINNTVICACPETHKLANDTHCDQIDPCFELNGGCSHLCENINGTAICSCPDDTFELLSKDCYKINLCLIDNGGCSHICKFDNDQVICECPENHKLFGKICEKRNPCETNNGGCSHFCNFINEQIVCECPDYHDLIGKTCEKIDPCLINNGDCSHECFSDEDGEIECLCPINYKLKDPKNCVIENPCYGNNGGCSHVCTNNFGVAKCNCPHNYVLKGKVCVKTNPCHENNGNCSHTCVNNLGRVKCECPDGHKLINGTDCEELNPCFINNGGCSHECSVVDKKVQCICPTNYELNNNFCVQIDPCARNNGDCSHECIEVDGQAICKCPDRYELIGKQCHRLNPCLINNGGCSHNCTNYNGRVKCACSEGFTLHGKLCLDTQPCSTNNGGCSHICQNNNGLRTCSCPNGYILRPNKRICKDINECAIQNGGCSHGCKNTAGSYFCTCPHGYRLAPTHKSCEKMDEINHCAENNGGCSHVCSNHNSLGSICTCPDGYKLTNDQHNCIEIIKTIDHCAINNGGCSHLCKNVQSNHQSFNNRFNFDRKYNFDNKIPTPTHICTCPYGFKLSNNNRTCHTIKGCSQNNGGCDQTCRNYANGLHKCGCYEGYVLQDDRRSCKAANFGDCSLIKAPVNGKIRCVGVNFETDTVAQIGTECMVWCDPGFKLHGDSVRVCNMSGNWGSNEAYCIPVSCPKLVHPDKGRFIPSTCGTGKTFAGEICRIYCRRGFRPINGLEDLQCQSNLQWNPIVSEEQLREACIQDFPKPFIRCPSGGQLSFDLPSGQNAMLVKIPKPDSNVDWWRYVKSIPTWAKQLVTTLAAGRTEITFTAYSPAVNSSASCQLVINVRDTQSPKVSGCPKNIDIQLNKGEYSKAIYWNEPHFEDNVGIRTTYKSKEPGTTFGTGVHQINYIASDDSGNRAYCHFTIHVRDSEITDNRPGRYRAVLICPSGIQYMKNSPDNYDNSITSQQGCHWSHVRVKGPVHPPRYRIPPHKSIQEKNYNQNMPSNIIHKSPYSANTETNLDIQQLRMRHQPFSWYHRCC